MKEFRVTKVFAPNYVKATVTVSIRVHADSHPEASAAADDVIWKHIFPVELLRPTCARSMVQSMEQIESGEIEEVYSEDTV
jgi:hypothetical protein